VIPKVAALAAKEHGDARKAIDILRYTGEIADEHGDDHVRAEYVDEAHEREEEARLAELIGKQPEHSKYLLQGLALQMQQSTDPDAMIPQSMCTPRTRSCVNVRGLTRSKFGASAISSPNSRFSR